MYNENFFKSLDDLTLTWKVKRHGGKVDVSGIAPQQRKTITDEQLKKTLERVLKHHADEEIWVNFEFRKGDEVVARQQFIVQPYQFATIDAEQAKVDTEETKSYVKMTAGGTTLTIGKQSGMIDYLDIDGQSMLIDRQSVTPEFWRAPTDNDYGAWMQQRFSQWKSPQMKVTDFSFNENTVLVHLDMPANQAKLTMTYTLKTDGSVVVRQQMQVDENAKESWLFRYGMQLQMPKQYNTIKYYGRGPHENYCDRKSSEFIGVYENKVADEYYPYIRPQESGNHTDIRWFEVTDGKRGLRFESNAPMECSALPYLVKDLDAGARKEHSSGQHSGDLVERPLTQVHIQQHQMGLGCVNSWGAWPERSYLLPAKQGYDFTFVMSVVK